MIFISQKTLFDIERDGVVQCGQVREDTNDVLDVIVTTDRSEVFLLGGFLVEKEDIPHDMAKLIGRRGERSTR